MSLTRKLVALIVVILAVLLLYPLKKTVVPEQRVLVVTKEMHPIRNAMVRQSWQDYSLERYSHEEILRLMATDVLRFQLALSEHPRFGG